MRRNLNKYAPFENEGMALGLLLHVPLAYYQPKVAEEIPETITETEDN